MSSDPERSGSAQVGIVLVHYHTPKLAASALAALRRDLSTSGIEAEWLLVDNGSSARERKILDSLPVRRIDPGGNVGYAAAANLGVKATRAENVLLLNPDVRVEPGCVGALLSIIRRGGAAAGPRLFWDSEKRFRLPPTEESSRSWELLSARARHRRSSASRARRRWRRRARLHWEATAPIRSVSLSGALLLFPRGVWERVGPFDEGFRMYFEETDWLRRLRTASLHSWYVPGAEAIHDFNQSAKREPQAEAWFRESAQRFRRRHYGWWFDLLLALVGGLRAAPELPWERPPEEDDLLPRAAAYPLWVEISPHPWGYPATSEMIETPVSTLESAWNPPWDSLASSGYDRFSLCVTDAGQRELVNLSIPAARDG